MAEQEQGFRVTDRRSSMATETTEPERTQEEPAAPQESQESTTQAPTDTAPQDSQAQTSETAQDIPLPEANLLTLVFSLFTHTQICLGLLPDPVSQQPQKDLLQAKYNIDLLTVLKEKTQGNLTPEEEQTLESILYEVRMAYVGAQK